MTQKFGLRGWTVPFLSQFFFTGFVLGITLVGALADALDTWTKETTNTGQSLYGVAHGTNRFVAVGQSGVVLVSSNGSAWTPAVSGTTSNLWGIAYGANNFVMVGDGGIIRRSTDGVNWTPATSPTTITLNGVAFANGLFIATGNTGTLLTSLDGVTWTTRVSGTTRNLVGAAYGNGIFMVVGRGSSNPAAALTSVDGVTWVDRSYPQLGIGFYAVAYGAGTFVAMDARGIAYTSTTGTNWTSRLSNPTAAYVYGLTYAQGLFVGVGGAAFGGQLITTSLDGIAWQVRTVNVTNSAPLQSVSYGNGYFVAVGQKGLVVKSGPVFTLRPPAVNGSNAEFTLIGEPGRTYRLQVSTNLAAGWQDWQTITNTSDVMPVTLPVVPGETRLLRALTP